MESGVFVSSNYDGALIHIMGTLNEEDKKQIELLIERIKIIEKYEILNSNMYRYGK